MKAVKKVLSSFLVITWILFFAHAGNIMEIESAADFDAALQANEVVVADFFATWCPPCQKLGPLLEEISQEYAGRAFFVKIDVDKMPELAQRHDISGIPDVRLFFRGKEINRLLGLQNKEDYTRAIGELV